MIMHVDGNSFYASCEALFRPDLAGKAIAVLTNNDGIIIALNQKCKDLGFKRGDVYFENRAKLENAGVEVFSSNYTLYSDISSRLNAIYNRHAPDVELYSIDESFLYFPDWKNSECYTDIGLNIKQAVQTEVGVPVSVGIAPDKTLAKMCNKLAKKYNGVCNWNEIDQTATLASVPVGDVWGVGRAKTALLESQGIHTALDLKNYPLAKAKQHLSITGYRTVRELNGERCIEQVEQKDRQSVVVSRSFSQAVFDLPTITGALAEFGQEAVKRLREEKLLCNYVSVWLMTNAYSKGDQYFNTATAQLPQPTAFFPSIIKTAQTLLANIYRNGYRYRKTMIGLFGLVAQSTVQQSLFEADNAHNEKQERLMQSFDAINNRYGRGAIRLGTNALARHEPCGFAPWEMKREMLSPCYTTNPADFPEAF